MKMESIECCEVSNIRDRKFVPSPQDFSEAFQSSRVCVSEDDSPRNHKGHLGSGVRRADNREFTPDSLRSLAHSLKSKMSFLPFRNDNRFDADAVVTHT
jgi:hypothetical protein